MAINEWIVILIIFYSTSTASSSVIFLVVIKMYMDVCVWWRVTIQYIRDNNYVRLWCDHGVGCGANSSINSSNIATEYSYHIIHSYMGSVNVFMCIIINYYIYNNNVCVCVWISGDIFPFLSSHQISIYYRYIYIYFPFKLLLLSQHSSSSKFLFVQVNLIRSAGFL